MNPLNFIPNPGDTHHIPGGFVICDTVRINFGDPSRPVTGEVILRFSLDHHTYSSMTQPQQRLPAASNALMALSGPALKPCPCGSIKLEVRSNGIGDFFVECTDCGKRSDQRCCEGKQFAAERWNKGHYEGECDWES